MSWNNKANAPNWKGIINTIPNNLIVSSIQTNYISTAVINVSTIKANTISSAIINVSTLNANTISTSLINTALINVSTLNTNNISSAVINVSSIFTNYLSSATANIPNLITSSINGTDIINFDARRWSFYPAVTQVEMAYNNLHNAGRINMAGDFTMAGTGNLFSPYWYNARIDANIYTGNINNLFNPTIEQYTTSYTLQNVSVDLNNGILSYPNASLKLYRALIFPVGNSILNAKNFYSINPVSSYLSGNYRGYAEVSVDGGDGTSCYLKINADIFTSLIPNTAPLTYQNGDSYLASITTLGVSRIATTYGDIQNLGTYRCQNVAGYFGTAANFSPVCSIKQEAIAGGAGGGTCLNIVDAGLFGARNDMIARNNYSGGGGGVTGVAMQIGSRGDLNIYSGATMRIGTNPGTYFADGQGAVYIDNVDGLTVRNISGIGGSNININNNVNATGYIRSADVYVANIHNNMAGATPINIVNSLNLCNNDINAVNNISTNTMIMYSKGVDSNASITFASSNGDLQTALQQGEDDANNTFSLASISSIQVVSFEGLLLLSGKGTVGIGSTESGVGITGETSVAIQATTGELSLSGNVRTVINGSSSYIDLSSNPLDFTDSIIDVVARNINLKGDVNGNSNTLYNFSAISTSMVSSLNVYTNSIFTNYLGQPNAFVPTPIKVNNSFDMQENDIFNTALIGANSISSINISTNTITANAITAPVNLNIGKSIIPFGGVANSDMGSAGFRWNNLWVSTISSIHLQTSTINIQNNVRASTIEVNRITGTNGSANIYTGNLFPVAQSAFIGYGQTIASGGFYAQGTFRSTITQVIAPEIGAGIYSNIVRIQGNTLCQNINVSSIFTSTISTNILTTAFLLGAGAVAGSQIYTNTLLPNGPANIGNTGNNFFSQGCLASTFTSVIQPRTDAGVSAVNSNVVRINGFVSTQNLFVSTINNKQYPFTSTLGVFGAGNTQSTFTVSGTSATTPQVLLQNIRFPAVGNYLITQKNTITKSSGGAGAEPYGSLCLTRGLYPSTFSTEDGFNSIPFINHTNMSTFNTFTTSITITNALSNTRNLTYYDQSGHNYDLKMAIGDLRIRYIPYQGLAGEIGL